jgi:hypothetical protein
VGTTVRAEICSCNDAVVSCCTVLIHVEALSLPRVECPASVTLACNGSLDPDNTGWPVLLNCVPGVSMDYYDTFVNHGVCGDPRAEIVRRWIIKNGLGDKVECEQLIRIEPFDMEGIAFPEDLTLSRALSCSAVMANPALTDPEFSGYPTINGAKLTGSHLCEYYMGYFDEVVYNGQCGGSYMILRHWVVDSECNFTQGVEPSRYVQRIVVRDQEAPEFLVSFDDVTIGTTSHSCVGELDMGNLRDYVLDGCSEVRDVTVVVSGCQVVRGKNGHYVIRGMKKGEHVVRVIASDECWNYSEASFVVKVEDRAAPVANCISETVVSLTEGGFGRIFVESIDNGSYDNCGMIRREIFRMTDKCGIVGNTVPGEYVDFCCEDIGEIVNVVLRVWDDANGDGIYGSAGDNFTECMVGVRVDSKLVPRISCPGDVELACQEDIGDTDKTGMAILEGGCGHEELFYTDVVNVNDCGTGEVIRTWGVVGFAQVSCEQRILIRSPRPFDGSTDIVWPEDWMGSCSESAPQEGPEFSVGICNSVAVSKEDAIFYSVEDVCYKILRRWIVIDWCVYDAQNPGMGGRWEHVQTLKIVDTEGPELESCEDLEIGLEGSECELGTIVLEQRASDSSCGANVPLYWSYGFDRGNTGVVDERGDFVGQSISLVIRDVGVGTHRIEWVVSDGCGNETVCEQMIEVRDVKAPSPVCIDELIAVPMSDGMIRIEASDFNVGSFDNCTSASELIYSFSGTELELDSVFDCEDIENGVSQIVDLEMWVWDLAGNRDFCRVRVLLQDNGDACEDSEELIRRVDIEGYVETEGKRRLGGVEVKLSSYLDGYPKEFETGVEGMYRFEGNVTPGYYLLSAERNTSYLEGVSTLDIVMIQRYLLGLHHFESAYRYIAADVNNDERISSLDIAQLRNLVLAKSKELPQSKSWRFVDAGQEFADPEHPWPVREEVALKLEREEDLRDQGLIGIKVGDVNGTATGEGTEIRSGHRVVKVIEDRWVEKGEEIAVVFYGRGIELLSGYQYTLHTRGLAYQGIEGASLGMSGGHVGVLAGGVLTVSYNSFAMESLGEEAALYVMRFEVLESGKLSEKLAMSSVYTVSEAYVGEGLAVARLDMEFREGGEMRGKNHLYQNEPNPFRHNTRIRYDLAEAGTAVLRVYDVRGRELYHRVMEGKRGSNEVELLKTEIGGRGVLYYSLEVEGYSATKKMIAID